MSNIDPTIGAFPAEPSAFYESATHDQIYPDLIKAFAELSNVATDQEATVPTRTGGQYSYKYMSLGAIMAAIRQPLAKHNLAVVQAPAVLQDGGGRSVEVSTRLIHSSGEWMETRVPIAIAQGADAQALGSAMTYARRYGVTALLGIASGDDDDGRAASSAPPQYAQPEEANVTTADARRRVLAAVGGEPGVEPTPEQRRLYEGAWAEFFGTRQGPYTESGVGAIIGLIPQWLTSQPSSDLNADVTAPDDASALFEGDDAQSPQTSANGAHNGSERVSTTTPGDDDHDAAREELAAKARAEVDQEIAAAKAGPDVDVDGIIAAVKAMPIPDVRMELGKLILDQRGNADTVRARLASHRIDEAEAVALAAAESDAPFVDDEDGIDHEVDPLDAPLADDSNNGQGA